MSELFEIVSPSFEVLSPDSPEEARVRMRLIEDVARTCYRSHEKSDMDDASAQKMVAFLRGKGHLAMLEFGGMLVIRFTVDRGVSHEMVRHRLCSFAQESTRYCDYNKKGVRVICPAEILSGPVEGWACWSTAMEQAVKSYISMRNMGVQPQIARSVLPTCTATEINWGANLTEWRHIFTQRAINPHAHPQMREVMIPALRKADALFPGVFTDLVDQL
jgi:thymidylate synthase (FAD)